MSDQINDVNVNNLGYFLDGWADVIEGMGDKEGEVREKFLEGLKNRDMPRIRFYKANGYSSLLTGEKRLYSITHISPGVSTTVYISKHGQDLFTSWRTFIKPVLNQTVFWLLVIGAAILGLLTFGTHQTGGGFFGEPAQTSFYFVGWLVSTIFFAILGGGIIGIVGRFWRGNFLSLFFIQPTVFDAEDITAMSLSVHKTILRALDSVGIDITKLRLKRDFKGGRRDEVV